MRKGWRGWSRDGFQFEDRGLLGMQGTNVCVDVRVAREDEIDAVKRIADGYRHELGFVMRGIFSDAQKRGGLMVAVKGSERDGMEDVIGFVNFRLRRDKVAVLYDVAVDSRYRGQSVGWRLMDGVRDHVVMLGGISLQLKCVEELDANAFYRRYGFVLTGTEMGKKRVLNVWCYDLYP